MFTSISLWNSPACSESIYNGVALPADGLLFLQRKRGTLWRHMCSPEPKYDSTNLTGLEILGLLGIWMNYNWRDNVLWGMLIFTFENLLQLQTSSFANYWLCEEQVWTCLWSKASLSLSFHLLFSSITSLTTSRVDCYIVRAASVKVSYDTFACIREHTKIMLPKWNTVQMQSAISPRLNSGLPLSHKSNNTWFCCLIPKHYIKQFNPLL